MRTRGYRDAHEAAGTAVHDELIVSCEFAVQDGYAAVRDLVDRGAAFDAVFALTDSAATGALSALAGTGRRVPDDVQVIGFDNLVGSGFTVPGLTTVEPGNAEMADAICSLLMERIEGPPVDGRPGWSCRGRGSCTAGRPGAADGQAGRWRRARRSASGSSWRADASGDRRLG